MGVFSTIHRSAHESAYLQSYRPVPSTQTEACDKIVRGLAQDHLNYPTEPHLAHR